MILIEKSIINVELIIKKSFLVHLSFLFKIFGNIKKILKEIITYIMIYFVYNKDGSVRKPLGRKKGTKKKNS